MLHTHKQVIVKVFKYVKAKFISEGSGHDWYHIERVWKNARVIAKMEFLSDVYIVELAALCHELGDRKLEKDGKERHEQRSRDVLSKFKVAPGDIQKVVDIVSKLSYSQNLLKTLPLSLEGKIVQDADRLEALGAIGLARVFIFAGFKGNPIYDPNIKPKVGKGLAKAYGKSKSTAINHFYEKLFLLKDKMNTKEGKRMATHGHKFLQDYLKQFFNEWKGIK